MRALLVRTGAWFATALLAAASADAATEFAENLGWLGGSARDGHQEAVLPVLLLGLGVALALAVYVACARICDGERSLLRSNGVRTQALGAACALIGSVLCTIAMEGYETRFGGLSPFDAQSVVMTHAPALVATFALFALGIQGAMRELLCAAERAAEVAARTFVRFVKKLLRGPCGRVVSRACAFAICVFHRSNPVDGGNGAFRAPPIMAAFRPVIA